jgi:CxxC motif-containing protein
MNDKLTCIMCPIGCELDVCGNEDKIEVTGNKCDKGIDFAREEVFAPKRNLATSVPINGRQFRMVSVRLSDRVPRHRLFDVLKEISRLRPVPPVKRGQVLIPNVLNSGADVIATRTVLD